MEVQKRIYQIKVQNQITASKIKVQDSSKKY